MAPPRKPKREHQTEKVTVRFSKQNLRRLERMVKPSERASYIHAATIARLERDEELK